MFKLKRRFEEEEFKSLKKPFIFFDINTLPKVLLALIFSFCPINNIKSICLVCKLFQKIIYSQTFLDLKLNNYAEEISLKYNFPKKEYYTLSYYSPKEKETNLKKAFLPRLESEAFKCEKDFNEHIIINDSFDVIFFYDKNIGFVDLFLKNGDFDVQLLNHANCYKLIINKFKEMIYYILSKKEVSFSDLLFDIYNKKINLENKYFYKKYTKINNKLEGKFFLKDGNVFYIDEYKNDLLDGKCFTYEKNNTIVSFYSEGLLFKKIKKGEKEFNIKTYFERKIFSYFLNKDHIKVSNYDKESEVLKVFLIFFDSTIIYLEKKNKLYNGKFYIKRDKLYYEGEIYQKIMENGKYNFVYEKINYYVEGKKRKPNLRVKNNNLYFVFEKEGICLEKL